MIDIIMMSSRGRSHVGSNTAYEGLYPLDLFSRRPDAILRQISIGPFQGIQNIKHV